MVTKISTSLFRPIVSTFKVSSKVTQVVLIALALLVTYWAYKVIRLYSRVQPPRQPQVPLDPPAQQLHLEFATSNESEVAYPPSLIQACGGQMAFDQLPSLEADEIHLIEHKEGVNSYVVIHPDKMKHPIMKARDCFNRPILAICYHEKGKTEKQVDIIFCRDPQRNGWYMNLEEGETDCQKTGRGSVFDYIKRLRNGNHPRYELG